MAHRPSGALRGVLLFSLGIFLFAVNDALGKWLVGSYGVGQLMLMRSIGAGLVLVPFVWFDRPSFRIGAQWWLHLLRVACMTADAFAFYFSTRALPLADVMTFYLAAPLVITALSVPLLGEKVGPFRWGAVLVGFSGVLVALHPSGAAISGSSLIALLGCTMFAGAIIITRKLRDTHWLTLTALQFAGSALVGGVTGPFAWVMPSPLDAGLMMLVGLVAMSCHVFITQSLKLSPASLLAPFQYVSIVWAVILGLLVWGDVPNGSVVLGSAIIVASGLVVFWRERHRGHGVAGAVEPIP